MSSQANITWVTVQFPFAEDPDPAPCLGCGAASLPHTGVDLFPFEAPVVGVKNVPERLCSDCGLQWRSAEVALVLDKAKLTYFVQQGNKHYVEIFQQSASRWQRVIEEMRNAKA